MSKSTPLQNLPSFAEGPDEDLVVREVMGELGAPLTPPVASIDPLASSKVDGAAGTIGTGADPAPRPTVTPDAVVPASTPEPARTSGYLQYILPRYNNDQLIYGIIVMALFLLVTLAPVEKVFSMCTFHPALRYGPLILRAFLMGALAIVAWNVTNG